MTTSTASAITAPPPLAAPKLRQRRPMRLFYLGVILLVVCGLAGGWLYSRGGQTISVVTTRATLKPGTPITADQLATVQLPAGTALSLIPAEKLTNVIGKYPTSVVPGGALLTPTMITDNLNPPAGQTLVGVGLKAGQLPARGLLGGDRVRIVITAAPTGGNPTNAQAVGTSWSGTVVSTGATTSTGITTVDILVDQGVAATVAAAAGAGNVAVILDTPAG